MVRMVIVTVLVTAAIHAGNAAHAQSFRPYHREAFRGGHSSLPSISRRRTSAIIQASATESESVHAPLAPGVIFGGDDQKAGGEDDGPIEIKDADVPVLQKVGCAGGCGSSGCCGSNAGQCECGCCDQPSPIFSALFGYDSWRGHPDGAWSNFGLSTGFNYGTPLGELSKYNRCRRPTRRHDRSL